MAEHLTEYLAKKFTPVDKLEPLYIYPKDCQVRK